MTKNANFRIVGNLTGALESNIEAGSGGCKER